MTAYQETRRRLPRDPAQRTAQEHAEVEMGRILLLVAAIGFTFGGMVGFVIGWVVAR